MIRFVAIAGLLLSLLAGCKHAPILTGRRIPKPSEVPPVLLPSANIDVPPPIELAPPPDAPTVANDPGQSQPWNVGLDELLTISLQNSDVVRTLDGSSVAASPITSYDPAMAEQRVRQALAAFDPQVASSLYGNWIHAPPSSFFGPGIPEPTRRQEAGLTAALFKPLQTGGEGRVAFNPPLGYLYLPDDDFNTFNPYYQSNIELSLRQPLLRGAGLQVNRAPIKVAQLRADQSLWDLKQSVMASVRSVVESYWDLQAAYVALRSVDEVIPLIDEVVRIETEGLAAQRAVRADVAKAKSQMFAFRQQRAAARSLVLERELRLRNLLGLPPGDGRSLIPVNEPARAPTTIDGPATVETALASRPDVVRQQLNVRVRELELIVARNGVRPQLDWQGLVRTSGLEADLGSSLKQMGSTNYSDWQTAFTFTMPLGRRAATANARAATYVLERERAMLRQTVHATTHRIGDILRQIEFTWQQYVEAENRVKETNIWLEGARIRYLNPPPAGEGQDWLLEAVNEYLLVMRTKADVATDASALLARYNGLLARLEEATGTLLENYQIHIEGDPCGKVSIKSPPRQGVMELDYRTIFSGEQLPVTAVPVTTIPAASQPSPAESTTPIFTAPQPTEIQVKQRHPAVQSLPASIPVGPVQPGPLHSAPTSVPAEHLPWPQPQPEPVSRPVPLMQTPPGDSAPRRPLPEPAGRVNDARDRHPAALRQSPQAR